MPLVKKPTVAIHLRLPDSYFKAAKANAKKNHLPMGTFLRGLLIAELNKLKMK